MLSCGAADTVNKQKRKISGPVNCESMNNPIAVYQAGARGLAPVMTCTMDQSSSCVRLFGSDSPEF